MLVGQRQLAVWMTTWVFAMLAIGSQAPAAEAVEFSFEKAFGPDGTNLSGFSLAGAVAVDHSDETVYVLDQEAGKLFKFDLAGNPVNYGGSSPNVSGNELSGLSVGGGFGGRQVAVDPNTHTVYLTGSEELGEAKALQAFQANGEPAMFTAGPGEGTNEIGGLFGIRGVAVDSGGNIYVSGVNSGAKGNDINVYSTTGALLISSAGGSILGPTNIAVDEKGVLYVLENASVLRRFVPSNYPISAETTYKVDPEPIAANGRSVAIEPLTNRVYLLRDNEVSVYDEVGNLEGTFGGPGEEGELSGAAGIAVANGEEAGIVEPVARPVVTSNPPVGLAQTLLFSEKLCVCPPAIEATAVEDISADAAVLRGTVNPNNRATTVWFEYGLAACDTMVCVKLPVVGGAVGEGRRGVAVRQSLAGLDADRTYYFRLIAESELGTTEGPNRVFHTQGGGVATTISDSRVWEMVSPAAKHSGAVVNGNEAFTQASLSGDKLAYASRGPIVEEPISNYLADMTTNLAQRQSDGRWITRDLTPEHQEAGRVSSNTPYKLFSRSLSQGLLEPTDRTPLSPLASEKTPYLWSADPTGAFQFDPLIHPGNVPEGTVFGPSAGEAGNNPVRLEGASADFSHIVFRSQVALASGAVPSGIYAWSDGDLQLVSELPDGEGGSQGMLGSGLGSVRHAISEDGSRVYWTPSSAYSAGGINLPSLFLRDTVADKSTRLDIVQPGASGAGLAAPAFNIASEDGTVAFFTDSRQLTTDSSSSGRDLYRCEIGPVEGGLGCADLSNISVPLGPGEAAEVVDQVSDAAEDGTRIYFVARGVLDGGPNSEGAVAKPGAPNLYLWQEGLGNRFLATLSENDRLVWGAIPGNPGYAERISADASPSGRYFAFTSEASLTGYENRNRDGELNTEVYRYDADAGVDGQLICVSCNPSGGAAVGEMVPSDVKVFPPDPAKLWRGRWAAATLPMPFATEASGRSLYRPRAVLDNGRVFFNSVDPLVASDANGNWDVYQYQPVGLGTCTSNMNSGAATGSADGCVGLISSGTSAGDAGFLDATDSGDDVFFLTQGRLSILDRDEEFDVYDARVNGVEAVLKPIEECAGDSCQPTVGAPNDPTPASESYRGRELRPIRSCRKGQRKLHRKGKARCVRKRHKSSGKHRRNGAGSQRLRGQTGGGHR